MSQPSSSPGPLAGLRVVELAGIGPGPFAAMLLADLGADVVRVDRPDAKPLLGATEEDLLNRGRRSVAVDLKRADGVAAVLHLVRAADVLLEGFRPGVAERLGLGPEDCHAANPRLVYGRVTGWGQDGPLARSAGHDISFLAVTGALHAIGRKGDPPQIPLNLLGDFAGGSLYLVVGVLSALWESRRSGRGQVVDAAIVDGTTHLSTMVLGMIGTGLWRDERGVNLLDSGAPFYDVYETSDGRHMAVGPLEEQFYAEMLSLLGLEDAPSRFDDGQAENLRALLAKTFRTRTQAEWTEVFEGTDACVSPVLSYGEAPGHPQLAARATYVEHHGVTQPAPAPRFSRTEARLDRRPARLGEHTREVLEEWGVANVSGLIESGAAVQRD